MAEENTSGVNLSKVISFAINKHKGQKRANGVPYIVHPLRVAELVKTHKKSSEIDVLVAAALLHYVLEDTYTSYRELIENFGEVIASIVMELTTAKYVPVLFGKDNYLSKKMANMTNYALVIKLCDRLDNVSDLNGVSYEKKVKTLNDTIVITNYLKENRELTGTQKKLIELIDEKVAEQQKTLKK